MILHCAQKLVTRIPFTTDPPDPDVERDGQSGPLSSRHANLLTLDRRQCVLFCHDATRYALFVPGLRAPQRAELGRWHRELLLAVLEAQGLPHHRIVRAGLTLGPLWVDCQTDRSVLGSLRVAAQGPKIGALDRTTNMMELEPIAISRWLNERPCRVYNRLVWPGQAMREIVEALRCLFFLHSLRRMPAVVSTAPVERAYQ